MPEPEIVVDCLSKKFDGSNGSVVEVLDSISFRVAAGEFVAIFGPNGSGKSTLLSIIGGIEFDYRGKVEVLHHPPVTTEIGHVFQDFSGTLFPWLDLCDNVAFGLKMKGMRKTERREKARAWLKRMDLADFESAYPYQISGGMKQKTCIARAFAPGYRVLLLDEPFSALDHDTTSRLQEEFLQIWQSDPKTTLFISHDVDEAILLSDRIIILSERPARIIKEVLNPLPRPRSIKMLIDSKFIELRKEIIEMRHEWLKETLDKQSKEGK